MKRHQITRAKEWLWQMMNIGFSPNVFIDKKGEMRKDNLHGLHEDLFSLQTNKKQYGCARAEEGLGVWGQLTPQSRKNTPTYTSIVFKSDFTHLTPQLSEDYPKDSTKMTNFAISSLSTATPGIWPHCLEILAPALGLYSFNQFTHCVFWKAFRTWKQKKIWREILIPIQESRMAALKVSLMQAQINKGRFFPFLFNLTTLKP